MPTESLLNEDDFLDAADDLLVPDEDNAIDAQAIRRVLAQSPLAGTLVLDFHGQLLLHLIEHVNCLREYPPELVREDATLLARYFEALSQLPVEEFMEDFHSALDSGASGNRLAPKPVYDALNQLVQNLVTPEGMGQSHPMLKYMTDMRVMDPEKLVGHMSSFLREQILYLHDKEDMTPNFVDTAQGCLLMAMRPLLLDTDWRPWEKGLYTQLWIIHDGLGLLENSRLEPREVAFISAMMQGGPDTLHDALGYLMRKVQLRDKVLDAFFPMPFEGCNAEVVLHSLVCLATEEAGGLYARKATAFMQRLNAHHPDVCNVVQTHIHLFGDATLAQAHSGAMVESFERIMKGATLNIGALPDGFNGPQ